MKLFIIRHGESQATQEGIGLGQMEGGLSPMGLEQAKLLAQRLKKEPLDAILTSPLQRAVQTSKEIIKFHRCPLIIDDRLKERNMGIFEGRPKRLFEETSAGFGSESYTPKGGENINEVVARAKDFYLDVMIKFESKTVAIIAHNFFNRALLSVILNKPVQETLFYSQDNACLNIIEIDETHTVKRVRINDVYHLEVKA